MQLARAPNRKWLWGNAKRGRSSQPGLDRSLLIHHTYGSLYLPLLLIHLPSFVSESFPYSLPAFIWGQHSLPRPCTLSLLPHLSLLHLLQILLRSLISPSFNPPPKENSQITCNFICPWHGPCGCTVRDRWCCPRYCPNTSGHKHLADVHIWALPLTGCVAFE